MLYSKSCCKSTGNERKQENTIKSYFNAQKGTKAIAFNACKVKHQYTFLFKLMARFLVHLRNPAYRTDLSRAPETTFSCCFFPIFLLSALSLHTEKQTSVGFYITIIKKNANKPNCSKSNL